MLTKYLSFCVLMFFCTLFGNINCQICHRRAVVTLTSREPYTYTYREQYETRCWYSSTCTKSRIRTNVGYRVAKRREVKTIDVCCDGYIRDDDESTDDKIVCAPICMPSCTNGYCQSPGECACNPGYSLNPFNPHSCLPQCSQSCDHGTCVAPDRCECNFGYALNDTCQPICTEPCINGKCTAPDTCECQEGFRKTENNTCEPYCSKGCSNGICIQPETCGCNEGFVMENLECLPMCRQGCGNGTCIGPDKCDCDPGYLIINNICEPICPDPCVNGYCAAPFTCLCDEGFTFHWGNCKPYCSKECGNGRCVSPETCECESGFSYTNSCDPYCCEAHCTKPCIHGSCIEPEVCDCDEGYKKDFTLGICVPDCIYDCGNGICIGPNQCECYTGFQEKESRNIYDEPVCEPICKNCEGKCISPYKCVCDSLFQERHEAADGGDCDCFENCPNSSKECERTICVLKSSTMTSTLYTTSENQEQEAYVDYGLTVETTSEIEKEFTTITKILTTEAKFSEDDPYTVDTSEKSQTEKHAGTYTAKQQKDKETYPPVWIYIVIAVLLIITAVTVLIIVINRKAVLQIFRGGSYVVEEIAEAPCSSSRSMHMTFSTIERNKRE